MKNSRGVSKLHAMQTHLHDELKFVLVVVTPVLVLC
jgi:hypothetical protein